ncbi:MAG: hypothetical protein IPH58_06375 [Sphingobacteriales bacterium]|jgi:protein CpxP|nr:hypothetical protein [Sphingobacteriales bacterium]
MNNISRNRVFIIIIVLLLLSNIFLIAYYSLFNKKHSPNPKGKDGFVMALKKEVGFDEKQLNEFSRLKETYWTSARKKMDDIRRIKGELFILTKQTNVQDSVVEKYADSIAMLQKQVEIESFRHFQKSRAICAPIQLPAYDSLMKKVFSRFGKRNHPPNSR